MKTSFSPAGWNPRLCLSVGGYRPWLLDRGSLTRRIQAYCAAFSVRAVRQGYQCLAGNKMRVLCREVTLYCGETPVVYAHSMLPLDSLRGQWRSLRCLGERPLGEVLFSNPRVLRSPLQFRKLHRHHWLYRRACRDLASPPDFLWARRSMFNLNRRPIQVTEVFLPGILNL
jgi:chorismate--pyruvate lyase